MVLCVAYLVSVFVPFSPSMCLAGVLGVGR